MKDTRLSRKGTGFNRDQLKPAKLYDKPKCVVNKFILSSYAPYSNDRPISQSKENEL